MKKISRELLRSYSLLIAMFVGTLSMLVIYIWMFLVNDFKKEIRDTEAFLKIEFLEPEHSDIEAFYNLSVKESPNIDNLYIVLETGGRTFGKNKTPEIKVPLIPNKIQRIGKKYYILNTTIKNLDGKSVDIRIIRDIRKERHFMYEVLRIYFGLIIFVLFTGICISKKVYSKIIHQINILISATNKISLKSFEMTVKSEEYFEEFASILTSYEGMLARVEKQTRSQIDFVQSASHELRSPLFVMGSSLGLIKKLDGDDREVYDELLELMEKEIRNMTDITEKLLFLAEQREIEVKNDRFSSAELMKGIMDTLKERIPDQNFHLDIDEFEIFSDLNLMRTMVLHIVENAVRFGSGNKIDIEVKRSNATEITVIDRGIGIPEGDLENIFNSFFRSDQSRNRDLGGHGLGLSIVKSIVETLQGEIIVKSREKAGTMVKVILP